MKKLMAMIGAVAMSFGSFAATFGTYSSTSFEYNDDGCWSRETFDWSVATGWSLTPTYGNPLVLADQDKSKLPYAESGTRARRDDFFRDRDDNNKFLKLDIPSNTLECVIGEGRIFIDQLIKFSECNSDPDLVEGSKIAVWMKEGDSGENGLFASVGTGSDVRSVQIAGEYEPDVWYRLTVKALGNVRQTGVQAGFLVYINGEAVTIAADDREYLDAAVAGDLTTDASGYYAQGRLFASRDTESAAISSVGYWGYGSIDDLIISETAPKFAEEEPYSFTIQPPTGLKVKSVTVGGEPLAGPPYQVQPGTVVRITYEAEAGYKITSDTVYDDVEIDENGQEITDTDVEFDLVRAQLFRNGELFGEYVEDELYSMITNLEDGDQVSFVRGSTIGDPDGEILYEFSPDTTVDVTIADNLTTWEINSANEGDWITDNVGTGENFVKVYKFEDPYSSVALGGDVVGELSVSWDEDPDADSALYIEEDVTVSGVMTAANILVDESITLSGDGKVITQTGELAIDADEGKVEIVPDVPEVGWYTYQINTTPIEIFTVTVNLGEGITAVATNKTQGGVEKIFSKTGSFEVNGGDTVAVTYACSVSGYKPTVAGVEETIEKDTELKQVDKELLEYTITYNDYGEWAEGFEPVESYTVETETFELPAAANIEARAGAAFQNWTNELGEVVTEVTKGSTGDLVLYAAWEQAGTDPVTEIIGDKVEGFDELPSEEQKAAYDNVQYLYNKFENVAPTEAWIASVYGDGAKVPAAKFAATTEEFIDISVKYDLPIMTTGVEVETAQAADGAFTFKLVDEGEDISLAAAKVGEMIEWSADLASFAVNTDEVAATVDEDGVTVKATFLKPNGETKGFMKLHLFADEK